MKNVLLGIGSSLILGSTLFSGSSFEFNANLKTNFPISNSKVSSNNNFGSKFSMLPETYVSVDNSGNVWAINSDKEVCFNGQKILSADSLDIKTSSNKIFLTNGYAFCLDLNGDAFIAINLAKGHEVFKSQSLGFIFGSSTKLLEVGKDKKSGNMFYLAIFEGQYVSLELDSVKKSLSMVFTHDSEKPKFPGADTVNSKIVITTVVKFTNNIDDSSSIETKDGNNWIVAYNNIDISENIKLANLGIKLEIKDGKIAFKFSVSEINTEDSSISINKITNLSNNFKFKKDKNTQNYCFFGFDLDSKLVELHVNVPNNYLPNAELKFTPKIIAAKDAVSINSLEVSAYDNFGDLFFSASLSSAKHYFFEIRANETKIMQITKGLNSQSVVKDLLMDDNPNFLTLHALINDSSNNFTKLYDVSNNTLKKNNTTAIILGSIFGVIVGSGIIGVLFYYIYNKKNSRLSITKTSKKKN